MKDLIEAYGPNIKKMFEEEPATLTMATYSDGGIYSLPAVRPYRPESAEVMMINKAWLDTLGLEIPTTLDELEQALIAFRDGDPNGNGDRRERLCLKRCCQSTPGAARSCRRSYSATTTRDTLREENSP